MGNRNEAIASHLYSPVPLREASSPEGSDHGALRLISIDSAPEDTNVRCRMWMASISEAARAGYFALSYVWGDPADTRTITVNGLPFQATKNLVVALRQVARMHQYAAHALWVDAVCINQHDVPERNAQVSMMGLIYTHACEVLCWLGPGDGAHGSNGKTIHFVNVLGQDLEDVDMHGDEPALVPLKDPVYSSLIAQMDQAPLLMAGVFRSPLYWTRVWTFQEMVLAHSCKLIAGDRSCYVEHIERDHGLGAYACG